MVLTIPIKANADTQNWDNFDHLNMEYWRYNVLKHGTYIPKKFFSTIK